MVSRPLHGEICPMSCRIRENVKQWQGHKNTDCNQLLRVNDLHGTLELLLEVIDWMTLALLKYDPKIYWFGGSCSSLESGLCDFLISRIWRMWCSDSFRALPLRSWQLLLSVSWYTCFWYSTTCWAGVGAICGKPHTERNWQSATTSKPCNRAILEVGPLSQSSCPSIPWYFLPYIPVTRKQLFSFWFISILAIILLQAVPYTEADPCHPLVSSLRQSLAFLSLDEQQLIKMSSHSSH